MSTTKSGPFGYWVSWEPPPPRLPQTGPYRDWVSWETSLSIKQVLMGTGLVGGSSYLPQSHYLLGVGLAGAPPSVV